MLRERHYASGLGRIVVIDSAVTIAAVTGLRIVV